MRVHLERRLFSSTARQRICTQRTDVPALTMSFCVQLLKRGDMELSSLNTEKQNRDHERKYGAVDELWSAAMR